VLIYGKQKKKKKRNLRDHGSIADDSASQQPAVKSPPWKVTICLFPFKALFNKPHERGDGARMHHGLHVLQVAEFITHYLNVHVQERHGNPVSSQHALLALLRPGLLTLVEFVTRWAEPTPNHFSSVLKSGCWYKTCLASL
jgi:hypothetical protein